MHILDNSGTASIVLLNLLIHRMGFSGKEAVCFLLRPHLRLQGAVCDLKLPIKAIAKPAGQDRTIPYRKRKAAGECGRHHRSFTRKVNDFLLYPEELPNRNHPAGTSTFLSIAGHNRLMHARSCFLIDFVDSFLRTTTILAALIAPSEGPPRQP
jgi:hypothetical protein